MKKLLTLLTLTIVLLSFGCKKDAEQTATPKDNQTDNQTHAPLTDMEPFKKSLSILKNPQYDLLYKLIEKGGHIHFNQAYLDDFYRPEEKKMNNMVIFNFETDDLKEEYERIKKLNIGEVSEILYVNVHMPYYYFNLIDPDGNIIEISGPYDG